jgi:hypothetical protein
VSSTALHIIELVKSLPDEEQRAICEALTQHRRPSTPSKRRQLERLPDGSYINPRGIPNDDPVFEALESIVAESRRSPAPLPPDLD